MFSQSLLPAAWRETAAPPDSSASSQAETTPLSRPVSAARRPAKVCWSEVSMVLGLAGRLPVAVVPVVAVLPVMALDSCEENDIDAPGEAAVEAVVLVD